MATSRMQDISGQKFFRLTAIKPLYKKNRERCWIWQCQCECGKIKEVRITKLKAGVTKSCGCLKQENIIPKYGKEHRGWQGYETLSLSYFNRLKINADFRNINFNLTIKDAYEVFVLQKERCAYTGTHLKLPTSAKYFGDEDTASLDRIDNDKGYQKDNIQWVCKRVNTMKHTMQEVEFLTWIKKIYLCKFGIEPQLASIIKNTLDVLEEGVE